MGRVEGKVVLITGSEGGMGFADAVLLASEGAKVVATDLDLDKLKENYRNVEGDVCLYKLDVTKKDDWKGVVDKVIVAFGKIDVLVNNAGIHIGKDILEVELDEFYRVIDINTVGVYLGMKEVIPHMQRNGGGSIVNIASLASLLGGLGADGGDHAYSASKGAVCSMTKNVAQNFAKDKIRANTIHPGPIYTPIMEKAGISRKNAQELYGSNVPLPPYVGEVEDIAYGVLYLASDESRYVTSQELVIDGGFSTQ